MRLYPEIFSLERNFGVPQNGYHQRYYQESSLVGENGAYHLATDNIIIRIEREILNRIKFNYDEFISAQSILEIFCSVGILFSTDELIDGDDMMRKGFTNEQLLQSSMTLI